MIQNNFIFTSKRLQLITRDDNKHTEKCSIRFKIYNSKVFVKGSKQHARHHNPFNF